MPRIDQAHRHRPKFRRQLAIETLEVRSLLSLSGLFAVPVAVSGGGSVDVESNAVVNDGSGAVYVTGSLVGTANFAPSGTAVNLTSAGDRDVFLAKYTKAGALVWAEDLPGSGSACVAQGSAIAVDSSGNVIIAGTFTGATDFDPSAGVTKLTATNRNDGYIAKYSATGAFLWADDIAGPSGTVSNPGPFDQVYALSVDGSGNVYAAGSFQGVTTFGSTSLTAGGTYDSFVTKLNSSGTFSWAKGTTGTGSSVTQAAGIAVDGAGNVVTTGFYAGKVNFDPSGATASLSSSAGSRDIYVQKLSSTGALVWAEGFGGQDIEQGNSVAVDGAGNVSIAGVILDSVTFSSGSGTTVTLNPTGIEDAFLLELTSSGQVSWASDLGGTGANFAQATGVGIDSYGHVFVAGHFEGTLALAPGNSSATLTSAGGFDVFVGEFSASGAYIAGQSEGGANTDYDFGVGVNSFGQVAIAGRYSGPATFAGTTLPAEPSKSIFIAELAASISLSTPSTPVLFGSDDSGVKGDGITNVTQPYFTGTADSSTTVFLVNAKGLPIGSAAVGANGVYSIQPINALAAGTYTVSVREQDGGGNVSPLSGTFTVTIDLTTPPTPSTPALFPADDSGSPGDGITNVKQPHLTGTAQAGTTVLLINSAGSTIGTGTATSGGTYSVNPTSALADGTYVLRAEAVEVAGNVSAPSGTFTLTIDSTPPATPSTPTLLASDDSGVKGDGITNVTTPHMVGTAEANASLKLLNAFGAVIGTTNVSSNGSYSVAPSSPLVDGSYVLRVQAIDAAGNLSTLSAAFTLTIDTTAPLAPSAPTLLPGDDSGALNDGITNVTLPHLIGTSQANATLDLLNSAGTLIGLATVSQGGTYSVQPTGALTNGTYVLQTQAIDAAGNLSPLSATFTLTIDTVPPAAPSTPVLLAADDSGATGDGITNVSLPHFTGNAEANATLELLNSGGNIIGTTTVSGSGTYTIQPSTTLADGNYAFHALAIDAAGNVSPASGTVSITIDTTPPAAPSAPTLLPSDNTGPGAGVTTLKQPHLIGTAEPNATLQLVNAGGTVIGTATVSGQGAYSVIPSSPLAQGVYVLDVDAIDAAGNVSPLSGTITLTIQNASITPATPSIPSLVASDDSGVKGDGITNVILPHLIGTGTVGTAVILATTDGTQIGQGNVSPDGSYSIQPTASLAGGTYLIEAETIDNQANVSTPSAPFSLTIDVTPPARPSAPVLLAADDSGVKGDAITNVTLPHLTGTAMAGMIVQIVNGSGNVIASGTADLGGTYSLQPTTALTAGQDALQAEAVDIAGNVSSLSTTFLLTIMTTPATPAAPSLSPSQTAGAVANRTTSRTPQLVGSVAPGLFVDLLSSNGTVVATTTAAAGTGSYTLSAGSNVSPGVMAFQVQVRDVAGNISSPSPFTTITIADTPPVDFNGDGKTDQGIFNPTTAQWTVPYSSGTGTYTKTFGATGLSDIPVAGDYDGIGKDEVAIYRTSTAQWYISGPAGTRIISFGAPNTDIAAPGDYDNVGYTELAVFRPSTAQWFVLGPNGSHLLATFGATNLFDIPVPGDYDGVGYTEPAIFRPSTAQWIVLGPTGTHVVATFGATNLFDLPVPGDYDGVGHAQPSVYRPSTGQWFVLGSSGSHQIAGNGSTGLSQIPLAAPIMALKKLGVFPGISASAIKMGPLVFLPPVSTPAVSASPTPQVKTPTAAKHAAETAHSAAIQRINSNHRFAGRLRTRVRHEPRVVIAKKAKFGTR